MSMVLFGKPAKELSAFEAVQTANALAQLTGKGLIPGMGGPDPAFIDRARQRLGLIFWMSRSAPRAASRSANTSRRISMSRPSRASRASRASISVDVDVNKWLSVKTDVGQDSQSTVGVFWKRDY